MRCPFAEWWGPVPGKSSGVVRPANGWILHVIVGSLQAANTVFHDPNRGASAHFGVGKDGRIVQWVDTADKAWAEGAGNPYWLSVETEGQPSEPLTVAQIEAVARLFKWGQDGHGPYPYTVADSPSSKGLGTHSMGGAAWGGHACPGSIRASQRAVILQIAQGQPTPPIPEEENVPVRFTHKGGQFIGVFGDWCRPIPTKGVWDYYDRAGVKLNNTDGTAEVQDDVFNQMTPRPVAG